MNPCPQSARAGSAASLSDSTGSATGHAIAMSGSSQRMPPSWARILRAGDLVGDVGRRTQYAEAVGEPGRQPQHPTILAGKGFTHPMTVRRRTAADVDGNVEDLALRDRDELALRERVALVVQTAQHPCGRSGHVVLHELDRQTCRGEFGALEALAEEATVVGERLRFHQDDVHDLGGRKGERHAY